MERVHPGWIVKSFAKAEPKPDRKDLPPDVEEMLCEEFKELKVDDKWVSLSCKLFYVICFDIVLSWLNWLTVTEIIYILEQKNSLVIVNDK